MVPIQNPEDAVYHDRRISEFIVNQKHIFLKDSLLISSLLITKSIGKIGHCLKYLVSLFTIPSGISAGLSDPVREFRSFDLYFSCMNIHYSGCML